MGDLQFGTFGRKGPAMASTRKSPESQGRHRKMIPRFDALCMIFVEDPVTIIIVVIIPIIMVIYGYMMGL